jgi:hypothetical protein
MIGTRTRFIALLAAVAATLVVVAGCGSSDDSTTDGGDTDATTASLTKAEFVEQGNAICSDGNEEIESGIEEFAEENGLSGNDQPTEAQVEELATDILIPSIAKQVEGLRNLGVPSGEEKEVEAFLDKAASAVEKVEADTSLLTDEEGGSPFASVNREAAALGLTTCGEEI